MKQITHEVRVGFVDTESISQTLQNCFNHTFNLTNPDTYTSGIISLIGTQTFAFNNVNFLYATSDELFRVVVNGNDEFVGNHFSLINIETQFNILFENIECTDTISNIRYFYGRLK